MFTDVQMMTIDLKIFTSIFFKEHINIDIYMFLDRDMDHVW